MERRRLAQAHVRELALWQMRFDTSSRPCDIQGVKTVKTASGKKTPGTLIVEKYRPRMNKLTLAERQELRDRAMQLAFGHESETAATPRR